MAPRGLGCFMVAGQCHEMGKGGGKGAPLRALAYFSPFGKALLLYFTSEHFFPSCYPKLSIKNQLLEAAGGAEREEGFNLNEHLKLRAGAAALVRGNGGGDLIFK